jgi:hypothetical protein
MNEAENSMNIAFALSDRLENDDNAIFNFRENSVTRRESKRKKIFQTCSLSRKNAREFLIACPFALKNV